MLRQAEVTTLLVTHDQDEALALADHLVLLRDGAIGQAGAPTVLGTDRAALFLGRATVVSAFVATSSSALIVDGLEVPIGATTGPSVQIALRVTDLVAGKVDGVQGQVIEEEYAGGVTPAGPTRRQAWRSPPATSGRRRRACRSGCVQDAAGPGVAHMSARLTILGASACAPTRPDSAPRSVTSWPSPTGWLPIR